jgi:hypothetical protein
MKVAKSGNAEMSGPEFFFLPMRDVAFPQGGWC